MKKSVVVLIGIIYIASIALVSFFGLKFKVFEEIVYVERVELLNEDLKESTTSGFDYYTVIYPDENGERRYQIKYRVYPDNATDQTVDFIYDKETEGVTIDENGVVIFEGKGTVIVQVIPKNSASEAASVSIAIISRDPK